MSKIENKSTDEYPPVGTYGPDDPVEIVFVLNQNSVVFGYQVTRKEASDFVRDWYSRREAVRKKEEGWEDKEKSLRGGTFALNYGDFAMWAVSLENIQGIYIRERDFFAPNKAQVDAINKLAEVSQRYNELVERGMKDAGRGEEWRGGDDL